MRRIFLFPVLLMALAAMVSCGPRHDPEMPKPDHIVVVIEENHGLDEIIGSPYAPYMNKLANEGLLFTQSHGVIHPSQPNYIALFSGELQGVKADECLKDKTPFTTPNLGAALIKAGYTFKGYAETLPSSDFMDCSYQKSDLTGGMLYARKHAPWVNWIGDKENNMPVSVSQPLTEFPSDFSQLPTVSFVIPNQDDDMHNNGSDSAMIIRGDQWLQEHLSAYVEWAKTHNSLFILTFDEDSFTPKNQIPTIFVGQVVKPGKYDSTINHYNVLRTIEDMYSLPASGSAKETPIKGIWNL